MIDTVLIDTDVILDFFFDREPYADYSSELFVQIERKEMKGVVTATIISNVYYLLRKVSTHKKVIEKLSQLMQLVEVINIDKQVILSALNSPFTDFENALQNFAGETDGSIDVIVTRNIKGYKNSRLSVLAPESYLKSIEPGSRKSAEILIWHD